MQAYVINLDRSKDRYAFVKSQFDKFGIHHNRIAAIDKDSAEDSGRMQTDRTNWPTLYDAEVACFLSHIKCWEIIAHGESNCGAVFEDDVLISKDLHKIFSYSDLPSGIDILCIESFNCSVKLKKYGSIEFSDRKAEALVDFQPGSAGYILTKSAAKKLLKLSSYGINCPVDHFLFDPHFDVMKSLNVRQLNAGLVIQQDRLCIENPVFVSEVGLRSSSNLMFLKKNPLSFSKKAKRETLRILNKMYLKIFTKKLSQIEFK